MVQGKKQSRKDKRKVKKNQAQQQKEDIIPKEQSPESWIPQPPTKPYDSEKAKEFDSQNWPGLSMFDLAQINKVRPVKVSSAGVLVFDFKGFPAIEMQLECIYIVVNCARPFIQGDAHFTSVVKIFDANGYRVSVRLEMGKIMGCERLQKGCSTEEIMGRGDETDNNSFVQVIKLCPRHLYENITEEGLALPTKFDLPTSSQKPVVNKHVNLIDSQLFPPQSSAKTPEEEKSRPVKLASIGNLVFDYEENVTKLSSPGTLLFDHKGFPAIEMKLKCIYVVAITKPSTPKFKAMHGCATTTFCEAFDGNGHKLYTELDHEEIVSCKIARKGCSYDMIKGCDTNKDTESHLEVIQLCPFHLKKFVTSADETLPKKLDISGLKSVVVPDKAVDELTEDFIRTLGDVE